ncbi:MAG: ABC transporter substrate-binding protein [Alphaproteobacteria bacterium]|nr:ABC transporter substrate-binding protein [Alphaproteobacteria bacterium]MBU0798511.1 ABC transporter substrate-binding protein [Alphaproteobacteria bacterium]MBU0886209.1 ABC transporter substrate-binding protein [Alphaproteobacteria bacterium]MBU1812849.1 ABC transporter substrate-binding protein [Alphaproteobacteria bacterium]MBU2091225.1 ABC transporter substrate-binding protein [Alphaproteobacteria bacterium]
MTITRRDVLLGTAAGVAAGAVVPALRGGTPAFAQTKLNYTPEKGAELRVLRWSAFVKGDEDSWIANTEKFTKETGVKVRIDKESWEDIRPKAAVAANVGSGPDIMFVWFDDPHQYPDKLLDVTDLADYLGKKYGGWYEGPASYAKRDGKFIGLPLASIGNAICYRESWMNDAGFKEFPKDTAGFLELCKAMKAKGHPPGFAHGHAVGDGNNFAHWILWSHGGRLVDENNKVVVNSPETIAGLKYARELYQTYIPGTESWLDVNNNRAFLAGEIGLTANGVSLYYAAKNDPKLQDMAKDIRTTPFPVGPTGKAAELYQITSNVIFKHTKFPNAAKAYLQFMFEEAQMQEWIKQSSAYCCQTLKAYANNPIWTSDPNHVAYAKASELLRPNGFAGQLGYASAGVMADYVVVDMVAEAATGQRSPEEAAKRAESRANRYYRV